MKWLKDIILLASRQHIKCLYIMNTLYTSTEILKNRNFSSWILEGQNNWGNKEEEGGGEEGEG